MCIRRYEKTKLYKHIYYKYKNVINRIQNSKRFTNKNLNDKILFITEVETLTELLVFNRVHFVLNHDSTVQWLLMKL